MFGKKAILAMITLLFVLVLQAYLRPKKEAFQDASGNTVVVGYNFWKDQNFWIVFAGMAIAFFVVLKVF